MSTRSTFAAFSFLGVSKVAIVVKESTTRGKKLNRSVLLKLRASFRSDPIINSRYLFQRVNPRPELATSRRSAQETHNLPLSCERCAEQERTWLDETLIARGSSTAVGGYLPARTAIKTTVQDRGSTRSSTWPLALGRNTHVCERSFRPWRSETSRTLDDKPGQ